MKDYLQEAVITYVYSNISAFEAVFGVLPVFLWAAALSSLVQHSFKTIYSIITYLFFST